MPPRRSHNKKKSSSPPPEPHEQPKPAEEDAKPVANRNTAAEATAASTKPLAAPPAPEKPKDAAEQPTGATAADAPAATSGRREEKAEKGSSAAPAPSTTVAEAGRPAGQNVQITVPLATGASGDEGGNAPTKKVGTPMSPTSALRHADSGNGSHGSKGERRVGFQDPMATVVDPDGTTTSSNRIPTRSPPHSPPRRSGGSFPSGRRGLWAARVLGNIVALLVLLLLAKRVFRYLRPAAAAAAIKA